MDVAAPHNRLCADLVRHGLQVHGQDKLQRRDRPDVVGNRNQRRFAPQFDHGIALSPALGPHRLGACILRLPLGVASDLIDNELVSELAVLGIRGSDNGAMARLDDGSAELHVRVLLQLRHD